MDKEYLDFVERMGSFEFELSLEDIGNKDDIAHSNQELDNILQHFGVKGMKWGVRRNREKSKSLKKQYKETEDSKSPGRVKQTLDSIKRERQWKKSLDNLDGMSNAEINKLANRIRLENDLKRLSKNSKAATRDDKRDYLNRAKLSDTELADRVNRLRAKDNLTRSISYATKDQRNAGRRFVMGAGSLALRYAMTGKVSTKDIGMEVLYPPKNVMDLSNNAINNILDRTNKTLYKRSKKKIGRK